MHPFGFTVEPSVFTAGDRIVLDRVRGGRGGTLHLLRPQIPGTAPAGVAGGAHVLSISANWPRARIAHWRSMLIARAIENQSCVIAVNRVGSDPDHEYGGNSMIIGPDGGILAEAGDTATDRDADLDLDELLAGEGPSPRLVDRRDELLGRAEIDLSIVRAENLRRMSTHGPQTVDGSWEVLGERCVRDRDRSGCRMDSTARHG